MKEGEGAAVIMMAQEATTGNRVSSKIVNKKTAPRKFLSSLRVV